MGYKLAGFTVLGGVEIDPMMMDLYKKNHAPEHSYLMGVEEFKNIPNNEIPSELFSLDILDGSPPCSSFSMAGSREESWGEKKKFREGQVYQVLDDLFFEFISIAKKLQPKAVVAENVKGLIQGNARGYVKEIFSALNSAGYDSQLFLLNSARMGVPQARERTFFIARRKDLALDPMKVCFNEEPISVSGCSEGLETVGPKINGPKMLKYWTATLPGYGFGYANGFNAHKKLHPDKVSFTQVATERHYHWAKPNYISSGLTTRLQTFPDDYDFAKIEPWYVCGMSVPPFMMQRVASQIHLQWFKGETHG